MNKSPKFDVVDWDLLAVRAYWLFRDKLTVYPSYRTNIEHPLTAYTAARSPSIHDLI